MQFWLIFLTWATCLLGSMATPMESKSVSLE
jgi:hypothetical protein